MEQVQSKTQTWLWILALVALFLVLTLVGTKVFYGSIVPNAQSVGQVGMLAVLGFSFLAGVAAFFAPCPFAVFPAYIAYYLNTEADNEGRSLARQPSVAHALWIGGLVSLGIFTFYLIAGVILALFGTAVAAYANWLKLAIIPLFFIAGWVLLSGKSFGTQYLDTLAGTVAQRARGGRHALNMFLYGNVYGIAAAACHLPILIVLALTPILAGSPVIGLGAFIAYAFGASLLLISFTVVMNRKREFLIQNLGLYGERVKKVAGVIFLLTGIYLISFYLLFRI